MFRIKIYLFSFILIFSGVLSSQQLITLTDEQEKYPLAGHMQLLEDPGGELTLEQVTSPENSSRFRASRSRVPNLGFTRSAIWVRFKIVNRSSTRSPWALELVYPNMNYADLYHLTADGQLMETKKTGNRMPAATRDHPYHHLVFLIPLPKDIPQTIYMRFKNDESMTIPLTLWSMTRFMKRSQLSHLLNGIFIGLLLIMIGFHLFLFFTLKHNSYLYYTLSITACLFFSMTANGIASIYLWPSSPNWNQLALPIFAGLMVMSIIKFADYFLNASKKTPLVHKITNVYLLVMTGLVVFSSFLNYRMIIFPMVLWGILGALLLIIIGFHFMIKGFHPARYFLAGIAAIGISGVIYLIVRLGILPSNPTFEYSFSMGIVLYMLLMSLALAERIKLLKGEKEKAIQELIESEERFRSLVETTHDFIWEVDQNGVYTYVSPKCMDLLGFWPEEMLGKNKFEIMPEKEARPVIKIFKQKVADCLPIIGMENKSIHKDGHTVILDTNGLPFFDGKGNLLGYRGSDREITDRRRLEEERQRLHVQIQHSQKLESLGVLAGGIAHDFNNLLMGVLGNASLTLKSLSNPIEAKQYVEKIEKSAHQAAKLTNQMLAYSGKGKFVVQPVNLSELVEEMTQLLKVSISKNVSIRYDFSPDLPDIVADVSQLSQVIMNLIVNASEAIVDKVGVISVRTNILTVDDTYLNETFFMDNVPEGEYVFLEISDNGIGMDKATQEKLFDPFFTTKFKGHGLGMAAVLGIVRGHKGAIKVYSELGQGTTIKVLFPSEKAVRPKKIPRETTNQAELAGKTVLVVDDEQTVREVIRDMLKSRDMKVLEAANGREGIEIYREHGNTISLVLLDTTMPEMNGEEVFKQLRQINPDVKVILISGYNEQDATSFFVGKGLAGFIQKPFTLEKLMEKLNELPVDNPKAP
jgi:PAS domain S-box-containing protein